MLDASFCDILEYKLCAAFNNSDNEAIKGFWCDGVLLSEPEKYYSPKYINDNRQATLKAYLGKDGQTEYELILKFGPKALSKYVRNLDIGECIPDIGNLDWFNIDTKNCKIEIQLY